MKWRIKDSLCLVLLQVPKCFGPVQFFWASPKIWLHLVPLQKLLCQHKNQFYWMQIIFLSGTKCLWLTQYVNKFLVWYKKFGPAQNILGQDFSRSSILFEQKQLILYFFNPIVLTIAKISKLIFLVQWIVMWIAKIASIAHFLKQKYNMSIWVFFCWH